MITTRQKQIRLVLSMLYEGEPIPLCAIRSLIVEPTKEDIEQAKKLADQNEK